MMNVKLINHAFLHNLTVEIWDKDELVGRGTIVLHTKDTIKLSDGMYYYKCMFTLQLTDTQ